MTSKTPEITYLFGGSFNPPHIGHVEICSYLLEREGASEVWVVPCFAHPFGKELAPFDDRMKMCHLAFKRFGDRVRVTDVERELGGISHTAKTIEYLKDKYPDKKFVLVVGSDVSEQKCDWKDFDRIVKIAATIEIPRGKDSPITDVSSTDVRRAISSGKNYKNLVTAEVASYIAHRKLY